MARPLNWLSHRQRASSFAASLLRTGIFPKSETNICHPLVLFPHLLVVVTIIIIINAIVVILVVTVAVAVVVSAAVEDVVLAVAVAIIVV